MPLLKCSLRTNLTVRESPNNSLLKSVSAAKMQRLIADSHLNDIELGTHWTRRWTDFSLSVRSLQRLDQYTEINESFSPESNRTFSTAQNTGESILRAVLRYDSHSDISVEGGGEAVYN